MPQTEDIDYSVDSFAIEDSIVDKPDDSVQVANGSAIKEIDDYLEKAIVEHNTFDVLNLPTNPTEKEKLAAFNMMAIHKGLVMHLRRIKSIIKEIAEEN